MNTYKRHRFPSGIISYVVWLYYRFHPSHRDIEDLLAERFTGMHSRITEQPDSGCPYRGLFPTVALLLAFMPVSVALADEWEQVLDTPELRVERRAYPGSALQEIRGTTVLIASLNAAMALLRDAPFNHHWVYRSGGAKILQQNGYEQAYVYGVVDAPWPMRDRDTIVRFDYRQNPETAEVTINITNFPDFLPAKPGLVRVPDFGGFWKLRPFGNGRVEVIYQVHGAPGGWIPVWLANYAAVTSVTRTLQNMPAAIERYSGAYSRFVREAPEGL